VTDDTDAIRQAWNAANQNRRCLLFSPGIYLVKPGTIFTIKGAACASAYEATIQDARFEVSGSDFSWQGGSFTQVLDRTNNPMFHVVGNNLNFSDMTITYPKRFTAFHVTGGASHINFQNITTNEGGQSAFTINGASDVKADNISMNGLETGQVDDGVAIIAGNHNQPTTNVSFTNVTADGIYDILKIGTAIVSPVRNISFSNLNAFKVEFPVFMEAFTDNGPGVPVENVIVNGLNMFDPDGSRQEGVFEFLPTNGSIWRNIQIVNVNAAGRFAANDLRQIVRFISDGAKTSVDGLYLDNWNIHDACNGAATCAAGGQPPQVFFEYQSNSHRGGNADVRNVTVADTFLNGASNGAVATNAPISNFNLVRNTWQNAFTSNRSAVLVNITGSANYFYNTVPVVGTQTQVAATGTLTPQTFTSPHRAVAALGVQGAPSQEADFFYIRNSAGQNIFRAIANHQFCLGCDLKDASLTINSTYDPRFTLNAGSTGNTAVNVVSESPVNTARYNLSIRNTIDWGLQVQNNSYLNPHNQSIPHALSIISGPESLVDIDRTGKVSLNHYSGAGSAPACFDSNGALYRGPC